MTPYNKILQLHIEGKNNTEIVRLLGNVSRKTVITVIKLADERGFIYPPAKVMSDTDIHRILHTKKNKEDRVPDMERTLFVVSLPGMSIAKVWNLYYSDCKDKGVIPYSKAQFQNLVNDAKKHIIMQQYRSMIAFRYIANAIGEDEHSYGLLAAELLGSHYIVATLIPDKKTRTWIHGITHIVRRLGYLPKECCFISHLPVSVYAETEDCLRFYGMELKTVDKSLATHLPEFMERVIRQYNDATEPLTPIYAVNAMCSDYNSKTFATSDSFKINDAFIAEKNILHEVPSDDYDLIEYTEVSPQFNHVQIDGMYYSIPFAYRHDKLTAYISDQHIEIHSDGIILCVHKRLTGRTGQYRTELDHLPDERDIPWNEPSGKALRAWADKIGAYTRKTIDFWLYRAALEVQAYKTCSTVLHLSTKHTPEALENTCRDAWEHKKVSYRFIAESLKNGK